MKQTWIAFDCPSCKSRLAIKIEYAHQRGRCPECATRIEPLRPAPVRPRAVSTASEPTGLVPIDDEWPEPARVLGRQAEEKTYELSNEPTSWRAPGDPAALPAGEAPSFQGEDREPMREPNQPPDLGYEILPVSALLAPPAPLPDPLDMPSQPPPPPRYPFWQGIYFFPFRPANLLVLTYLSIGFTLIALLATGMVWFGQLGGAFQIAVVFTIAMTAALGLPLGVYASGCFFTAVEETAAGNDRIQWVRESMIDGLLRFVFLTWLLILSAVPGVVLALSGVDPYPESLLQWLIPLLPALFFFPLLFLSSLAAGSPWKILSGKVIWGFIRKPHILLLALLPSAGVLALCGWLAMESVGETRFLLSPALGVASAVSFLLYGRLLGRVGWLLTDAGPARRRKKWKARRPKTEIVSTAAWGP